MWEKVWRWEGVREDVKRSRCEEEQMWRWEDVKMRRCEDEQMWRWEGVRKGAKMRRCEDEKMWRWADVKMSRCEDEKVWEKVWRWEDVERSRCERRCEDEKMRYRPPLLEEPCAQTLSGIRCWRSSNLPPTYGKNRIQIKISNGLQKDLKWTFVGSPWKPPLCTYMIELKHPSATVPI